MGKRIAPLLIAIFVAAGLVVHWEHSPALSSDDHGQYLLHARNLIEGRPYADIGFLHSKHTTLVAPIAEPPLVPYAIAVLFRITGSESISGVRVMLAAFLFLFGWCAYRIFAREDGPAVAVASAVTSLVLPLSAHSLDTVLADLPYCAFVWLACLLAADESSTGWKTAGLALAGAAAFASRMAALPLLPAAAMLVLLRPGKERIRWAAVLAVWAVAAYFVMFAQPGAEVLGGESVGRELRVMVTDLFKNAKVIAIGLGAIQPLTTPWSPVTRVIQSVALTFAAAGIAMSLARRFQDQSWFEKLRRVTFLEWTIFWTVAMLLALPVRDARYAWVILPFFAAGMVRAVLRLVNWKLNLHARFAQHTDTGWLIASPLLLACSVIAMRTPAPELPGFQQNNDLQRAIQALQNDIKSGESPRVAIFAPRVFTWQTRIPASPFYIASPAEMAADLKAKKITHVITGDGGKEEERVVHFRKWIDANPAMFPLVFADGKFAVHRAILAEPPPQSAAAATSTARAASGN